MEDQLLMKFKVRNTSGFLFALVTLIVMIILTYFVAGGSTSNILYFFISLLIFYSIIFIVMIARAIQKSSEILFYSKSVMVHGKSINIEDIDVIMKSGLLFGIKPKYTEIVPANFSFRFSEGQEDGVQYLESWAAKNNIELVNQGFVRAL